MSVLALRAPGPFTWQLRPPGSKSLTNRALLLAALAEGTSRLRGWLDAEDTHHMRTCLGALGIPTQVDPDGRLQLHGLGGKLSAPPRCPTLDVGTAGTVARFLLPALIATRHPVRLDGSARMRERPMRDLIEGLRQLGAHIECLGQEGFLPLEIAPSRDGLRSTTVRLQELASSQFVSGLVFAGLLLPNALTVVLERGTPARPYVDMTLACVAAFGGDARWSDEHTLVIQPSQTGPAQLVGRDYDIEPDASAASYPLALAAIWGGDTTVQGLDTGSHQGDARFVDVLERFGAQVERGENFLRVRGTGRLRALDLDLHDMPDMTLTAAVVALFADGPTRIRGVDVLRHHESDRLAAGATELRKLGAAVTEYDDGLLIVPPEGGPTPGVSIATYRDHRMAMAFSMVGNVTIEDPQCVAKTFPTYFEELARVGMVIHP